MLLDITVVNPDSQRVTLAGAFDAEGLQPSPLVPFDAQVWWTPTEGPQAGIMTHVHMAGALPIFQVVRGTLPIAMQFKLHHADGVINRFEGPFGDLKPMFVGKGEHLIEGLWVRTEYDSTRELYDGKRIFRFETNFQDADPTSTMPNRKVRLTSLWTLANGKEVKDQGMGLMVEAWPAPDSTEGRGYSNVTVHQDSVPLPGVAVPALWTVRFKVHTASQGQTRRGSVHLDPDVHAGNMGVALFDKFGLSDTWNSLTIDTRTLTPGAHKLMFGGSDEGLFPTGILESKLVLPFGVAA
jgi:hypothetical protein